MAGSRYRVLIADDDAVYCKRLAALLNARFHVETVASLADLMTFSRKSTIDAVLLDLSLRDAMDFDVAKFVGFVVGDFPGSAVLVLTGDVDRMKVPIARSAGARDYIFKGTEAGQDLREKIVDAVVVYRREIAATLKRSPSAGASMSMSIDYAELSKALKPELDRVVHRMRRPPTGVQEPVPTPADRVRKFVRSNWRFIVGCIAASATYLVDFRDRVKNYTEDLDKYRVENSQLVDKNRESIETLTTKQELDAERLERAVRRQHVLSVEATEQIQREIRAANPRAELPDDSPALRAAKIEVREVQSDALFRGEE